MVEEEDADENPFDLERLVASTIRARAGDPQAIIQTIREDLRSFRAGENPMDDATIIAISA
ncbi:MAG: SpoIIE family protein phosphatase [Bryobacterales bacterium]